MTHLWKQSLYQKQLVRLLPCEISNRPTPTNPLTGLTFDLKQGMSSGVCQCDLCSLVEACRHTCEHMLLPPG